MLALVLVGVVVAAHTDHPAFWLLIGPTTFAVLHTTRTFLRERVIRREGPLMFLQTGSIISGNSSNKTYQPDRRRLASAYIRADSEHPTLNSEMHAARPSVNAISRTLNKKN